MSIVALKRKTQAKYNNLSVGTPQFSLNGGFRNQGYVGQDSLGRYLSRTIYGGNVPKGNGGCCGTYRQSVTTKAGIITTEKPNIIKPSVMNTKGMLNTKYRWVKRPQPFMVVKPDTNNNITDQSSYINNLSRKSLDCSVSNKTFQNASCSHCVNLPGFKSAASRNVINTSNVVGDPAQVKKLSLSQSEYIEMVFHRKCQQNNIVYVASNSNGIPFVSTPPLPPTDLMLSSNTDSSITYTFTPSTGATSYTATAVPTSGSTIVQTGITSSPATITGLQSGTQYTITMVAINSTGSSSASSSLNTYTVLLPPTDLYIDSMTESSISIGFTPSNGAISYSIIVYAADSGMIFTASTTTNPATVSGLDSGSNYQITMIAYNNYGSSDSSDTVNGFTNTM